RHLSKKRDLPRRSSFTPGSSFTESAFDYPLTQPSMTNNMLRARSKKAAFGTAFFLLAALPAMAQEAADKPNALDRYLFQGGPLTIFIVAVGLLSLIALSVYN